MSDVTTEPRTHTWIAASWDDYIDAIAVFY